MRGYRVRTIGGARIDGQAVTKSQRPLVAALVLWRKEGATIDALVDAVWPRRAPTTATNSIQNQIARLRQTFGRDLIATTGDRYQLAATTDLELIDRVAAICDGRRLASGDAHVIAYVLSTWHGQPYADLPDDPRAQAELARLHHVQSRLVETLALSRLADPAGNLDTAIVDLTVQTTNEPLHEQAWELLVAAQHRTGRRTEALGTYARFAEILHREVGAAPSRHFQQLRALVDADESIDPVSVLSPAGAVATRALRATA